MSKHKTLPFESRTGLNVIVLASCCYIGLFVSWVIPNLGSNGAVIDFDAFYIASQMVLEGKLDQAYQVEIMRARQSAVAGKDIFMPWTYPPQFNMLIAPISLLPRGVSYLIFIGLSLLLYILVLQKLAGRWLPGVLLAMMPALWVVVLLGQSGLLIAALIGLTALGWLGPRQGRGGIALGLLVIKPHLALGIGLLVVLTRQWRIFAVAALVVVLGVIIASLVFGWPIWLDFREATAAASANMAKGLYPLFRMTSVYALLYTLGLDAQLALSLHAGVALLGIVAMLCALRARWPMRRQFALAVVVTLAISPYNYDYDMPILGVALALIAPEIMAQASARLRLALLAALWLCGGAGVFMTFAIEQSTPFDPLQLQAWGAVGFGLSAAILGLVLYRAAAADHAAAMAPPAASLA